MYTVGGAISGVIFGKLYEKVKKYMITIAFIGGAIGVALMNAFAFASTYWISFIGNVTGDVFLAPLKATIIGFAALGVIFLFVNPYLKEKAVESK